jgi:hypothetical protein
MGFSHWIAFDLNTSDNRLVLTSPSRYASKKCVVRHLVLSKSRAFAVPIKRRLSQVRLRARLIGEEARIRTIVRGNSDCRAVKQ